MNETICFPEDKIPEVVKVIEAGIKTAKVSRETKTQLRKQCKQLEAYWKRLQAP